MSILFMWVVVMIVCMFAARAQRAKPKSVQKCVPNAGQIQAGEYGELQVAKELDRLKEHLYGYVCTGNVKYDGENFECDFLLAVKGYGLVLLEVKYFAGQVNCSGREQWTQLKQDHTVVPHRNACLQVLRTRGLVAKLLADHNLLHGKIMPAVVFSHRHSQVMVEVGPIPTQCKVTHISQLAPWLKSLARLNHASDVESKRFERIGTLLKQHEVAYHAA